MRFRQFYSKLYFRVAVDLVGWPDWPSGGATNLAPHFFQPVTERLHKQFTFAIIESKITNKLDLQPLRAQWMMVIENGRIPEYPDKNDSRFNLTGSAAVRRCVEHALADATDIGVDKIIDSGCVDVTAVLIP